MVKLTSGSPCDCLRIDLGAMPWAQDSATAAPGYFANPRRPAVSFKMTDTRRRAVIG